MTRPRIIALTSPCPGSGKSTVARMVHAQLLALGHGAGPVQSFATPLKDSVHAGLDRLGFAGQYRPEVKDEPIYAGGPTLRALYTDYAERFAKANFGPDVWTRAGAGAARALLAQHPEGVVVFDDLRAQAEVDALRRVDPGLAVLCVYASFRTGFPPRDVDRRVLKQARFLMNRNLPATATLVARELVALGFADSGFRFVPAQDVALAQAA